MHYFFKGKFACADADFLQGKLARAGIGAADSAKFRINLYLVESLKIPQSYLILGLLIRHLDHIFNNGPIGNRLFFGIVDVIV